MNPLSITCEFQCLFNLVLFSFPVSLNLAVGLMDGVVVQFNDREISVYTVSTMSVLTYSALTDCRFLSPALAHDRFSSSVL